VGDALELFLAFAFIEFLMKIVVMVELIFFLLLLFEGWIVAHGELRPCTFAGFG
jgi:hypothetical protein